MIIACPSCPAQYSVPDAKLRGRKVRATCKHCKSAIIVDATSLEQQAPSEAVAPERGASDATRLMPSYDDPSVHEEKTVVGQVPRELLEAERQLAQAAVPSPAALGAAPELPELVPERAPNQTREGRVGVWLWLLGAALVLFAWFWLLGQP